MLHYSSFDYNDATLFVTESYRSSKAIGTRSNNLTEICEKVNFASVQSLYLFAGAFCESSCRLVVLCIYYTCHHHHHHHHQHKSTASNKVHRLYTPTHRYMHTYLFMHISIYCMYVYMFICIYILYYIYKYIYFFFL